MFRYRTRMCVLQLATASDIVVVDTLATEMLPCLARWLEVAAPEKIVHDLAFDARLLCVHGVRLQGVFDTALAARFLGHSETGLAALVAKYFDVTLPKHRQNTDWGRRPLDAESLRYLADDVAYLHELAARLLAELRAQGIEAELRTEVRYQLAQAHIEPAPKAPWMRIKGAGLLPAAARARLYALAEARERLAQELDMPPGRIASSDHLLRIARAAKPPAREQVMHGRPGLPEAHKQYFVQALARASELSDAPSDQVRAMQSDPSPPGEIARRRQRQVRLRGFRDREALARGVSPQVVLPGHCIQDLSGCERLDEATLRGIAGLGECRLARYGDRLIAELGPGWSG